jgi:ectoine hydroxylase-related dioxygenase (phytanoyl-CoA dioxygenase family)
MLNEEQIEQFRTVGGVRVRGLLGPEWIDSLREASERLKARAYDPLERMTSTPPAEPSETLQADEMWRDDEDFRSFLFDSPLGRACSDVVESSQVRLYEDLFQWRAADVSGAPGWHRDSPFWPVSGQQLVNAWFALEAVTAQTGAIRFVAGSHLDDDATAKAPLDPADPTDGRPVEVVEAEPGDVVLFHPRALHTGQGTNREHPRRTFTIRFLGDDVRWHTKKSYYHPWMGQAGLAEGDVLDHPGFPVVWAAASPASV